MIRGSNGARALAYSLPVLARLARGVFGGIRV